MGHDWTPTKQVVFRIRMWAICIRIRYTRKMRNPRETTLHTCFGGKHRCCWIQTEVAIPLLVSFHNWSESLFLKHSCRKKTCEFDIIDYCEPSKRVGIVSYKNSLQSVERDLLPKVKIVLTTHVHLLRGSHGKQHMVFLSVLVGFVSESDQLHKPENCNKKLQRCCCKQELMVFSSLLHKMAAADLPIERLVVKPEIAADMFKAGIYIFVITSSSSCLSFLFLFLPPLYWEFGPGGKWKLHKVN